MRTGKLRFGMLVMLLSLFALRADAQYCLPNYAIGCTDLDDINDFSVTGAGSTAISDIGTGCSAGGYRNMSSSMSVTFQQGNTYNAFINTEYFDEAAEVFIDFNNDFVFSPSESVGGENYIDDIGVTFPLYIPYNAALGTHRMRVVLSYDYGYPGLDACPDSNNFYTYGEVHDYTAVITAGTSGPPCAMPASTSASGTTTVSSQLAWSAFPGALGYEYVVDQTPSAPIGSGTFTTATTYTATGLTPNTVYHLHVRTKCSPTTWSPWAEQQFVTAFSVTCPMPSGFSLTALSNNSATLSWNASAGPQDYEIFLSSTFLYPLNGQAINGIAASYNNLLPNTTYYGWVRHLCSPTDQSDWALLTFRTNGVLSQTSSTISGNIYKPAATIPGTDTYKVWLVDYNSAANTLTAVDSFAGIGQYIFNNVPTGSYLVKAAQLTTAANPLQVPTYHDSSLYWSGALTVNAGTPGNYIKHVWMRQGTVTAGPGFIGGNVSLGANKGAGAGVPNMLIILRNAAGKLVKATYTNSNGDFTFNALPVGVYSVYPEFVGFATTPFNSIGITAGSASRTGVNFNQDYVKKNIKPRGTGIASAEAEGPSVRLFPNPARGTVGIAAVGFGSDRADVSITAITGQEVLHSTMFSSASNLDISGLRPGLYLVHVRAASGEAVQKLVVQ